MNIETLFKNHYDVIISYFDQLSNLAIVLIDKDKKILDCNNGFIKILGLREKPINCELTEFLSSHSEKLLLPDRAFNTNTYIFKGSGNVEVLLRGFIFPVDNFYLLILQQYRLTYNELITKMSILNDQIVDITRQLEKKNLQLSEALTTIKKITNTDPLTGILNRRAFQKALKREISFAKRHNLPLSLVIIDIDYFKRINDTYGHDVGDYVLKNFAKIILKSIRHEDIFARFGGEEFVILLPNTNINSAFEVCERIRQKIEKTSFKRIKEKITASFGISELIENDREVDLIKRADEALYEAKRKGRNRCEKNCLLNKNSLIN